MDLITAIREIERLQFCISKKSWWVPVGCGLNVYVRDGEYSVTAHKSEKGSQRWCNITLSDRMREKVVSRKIDKLQRFLGT